MAMTNVERFWVRVATDAEYQDAFRAAVADHPTPDDLAHFARETGFELSAADFLDHARERNRTVSVGGVQERQIDDGELSDEMLESVAGGGSEDSYASDPLEMDIYATWDGLDLIQSDGGLGAPGAAPGTTTPGTTTPGAATARGSGTPPTKRGGAT